DLEEEGLEGFVGAVELVDQEDGRACRVGGEGIEEGAAEEEAFAVEGGGEGVALDGAGGFGEADSGDLGGRGPAVGGGGGVESRVALEADQAATEGGGEDLGDLGLADASLSLEENRLAEAEAEVEDGGQARIGEVTLVGEPGKELVDGGDGGGGMRSG